MINLKTSQEIDIMKIAGKIGAQALALAGENCKEGVSTWQIDKIVEKFIKSQNAVPNFLGEGGYPAATCISVNDTIIHGIPSKDIILKNGDIVSVDVGVMYNGFHSDNAYTFQVGVVSKTTVSLLETTQFALNLGIEKAIIGNRIGDISHAIEEYVNSKNYGIVKEFVGHGIGSKLHEDPAVPNYGPPGKGARLLEGMVLAIEPMVNEKGTEVVRCADGWTVKTQSGCPSAHFEHTVAITANGPLILTKC